MGGSTAMGGSTPDTGGESDHAGAIGQGGAGPTGGSTQAGSAGEAGSGAASNGTGAGGAADGGAGARPGGAGDGGATGAQGGGGEGGGRPDAEPGVFGAVRLLVDGVPKCGGTLLNNSWVLSADRCIPKGTAPSAVSVGFGMSSLNFQQVRRALEIQRFPGNTGSVRVRDLVLIGVEAPFEINGSTTNHVIPLFPPTGDFLLRSYRCVAWDLSPNPDSPTDTLKSLTLQPSARREQADGETLWWENSDPLDPLNGTLFTQEDAGSGCFSIWGDSIFLAMIHSENPAVRRDGKPNENDEAYSITTVAPAIHDWLDQVLFRALPETYVYLAGAVNSCSITRDSVELFGLGGDGRIGWYHRESATNEGWQSPETEWTRRPRINPPPAIQLAPYRPGLLCFRDGSIELLIPDISGLLWRQHHEGATGNWLSEWELVRDVNYASAGVSVVGRSPKDFHVFNRTFSGGLEHVQYVGGWKGIFENLEGNLLGPPAARLGNSNWFDVFVRDGSNQLLDRYQWSAPWASINLGMTLSAPAVTSWGLDRMDLVFRGADSQLNRRWYEIFWLSAPAESGLLLPPGELAAVAREPGNLDVFVSNEHNTLWHAIWPRLPEP